METVSSPSVTWLLMDALSWTEARALLPSHPHKPGDGVTEWLLVLMHGRFIQSRLSSNGNVDEGHVDEGSVYADEEREVGKVENRK